MGEQEELTRPMIHSAALQAKIGYEIVRFFVTDIPTENRNLRDLLHIGNALMKKIDIIFKRMKALGCDLKTPSYDSLTIQGGDIYVTVPTGNALPEDIREALKEESEDAGFVVKGVNL